jgi:hypothetical protein
MMRAIPFLTAVISCALLDIPVNAQESASASAVSSDHWSGSSQFAAKLATQPRDSEWANSTETAIEEGIENLALDGLEISTLDVECRSYECGIAFNFLFTEATEAESEGSNQEAFDRIRLLISETSSRIGLSSRGGRIGGNSGPDGLSGHFENVYRDNNRVPRESDRPQPGDLRSIDERAPMPFSAESLSGQFASEGVNEDWSSVMEREIANLLADEKGWPGSTRVAIECRTTVCGVVLSYENVRNPSGLIRDFSASLRERFATDGVQWAATTIPTSNGSSGYFDILIPGAR